MRHHISGGGGVGGSTIINNSNPFLINLFQNFYNGPNFYISGIGGISGHCLRPYYIVLDSFCIDCNEIFLYFYIKKKGPEILNSLKMENQFGPLNKNVEEDIKKRVINIYNAVPSINCADDILVLKSNNYPVIKCIYDRLYDIIINDSRNSAVGPQFKKMIDIIIKNENDISIIKKS